jgi:hypothetical protein
LRCKYCMIVLLYYYAEAVEVQEDVTLRGLEESKAVMPDNENFSSSKGASACE